jgi:hypothetical protein
VDRYHDSFELSATSDSPKTLVTSSSLRAVPLHSVPAPAPARCCAPDPRESRGLPCDGSPRPTPRRPTAPCPVCARTLSAFERW